MEAVRNPRAIVNRRRLVTDLSALSGAGRSWDDLRPGLLRILRRALDNGRAEIRRRFEAGASGTDVVRADCYLVDQIMRVVFDVAVDRVFPAPNPTAGERLAVVAVGGYGRRELAPYSDVDLLFLYPYKLTARSEQVVEYMLYILWDLGLKVGHAARSVDECLRQARFDHTIRTNLLESRYLWGDRDLYRGFRERFEAEIVAHTGTEFVEAKLAERDARHKRMGDSRYLLEPNVKEGKGGLRDLHTLFWIAKYLYRVDDIVELVGRGVLTAKEVEVFTKAQNFLWTVRCHLHYLTGRAEDRLTFDLQPEVGRRLGYTDHAGTRGVERFMKHYFLIAKDVGDLTRIFCAALEAERKRRPRFSLARLGLRRRSLQGFLLEGDRLTVAGPGTFRDEPVNMIRLFHVAQAHELDIHPQALRWITRNLRLVDQKLRRNREANRLFVEILTSPKDPETTLRRMNEAGVFGRFLPDFGRVVAQMQHDMYHVYTVDEHTIRAIGILSRIEKGDLTHDHPLSSEVVHKVLSRRVLYLAVLLHDIAKGRGGDHSEIGAGIALKVCPRLGLSEEETETVAWLVRHHLLMSHTAQKRDISDPQTVRGFIDVVQSLERLRLLVVLTVCDMRATGPNVFNHWKAALLRDLYYSAEELMSGGLISEGREKRVRAAQAALREKLADWPEEELRRHFERGPASYWLAYDAETHARHAHLVRDTEAEGRPCTIDARVDRARDVTEVTIYTADNAGLFSKIAGAMAVSGANIVDARIFTLTNGMALDTFWVQDAQRGPFDRPDRLARLTALIERALAGRLRLGQELKRRPPVLPSRARVFRVAPRVLIDNKASATHTVIEVNARDRAGLLHDVTRTLTDLNLQISNAKISTYGERAVDAFYVKNLFGLKVEQEGKLDQIRGRLMEVLAGDEAEREARTPSPARPPRRRRRRTRKGTRAPATAAAE